MVVAGGVTLKLLWLPRVALARRAVVVCRLVERGWLHQTQLPPPWSALHEGWEALPVCSRPTLPGWAHAAVAALGFGVVGQELLVLVLVVGVVGASGTLACVMWLMLCFSLVVCPCPC